MSPYVEVAERMNGSQLLLAAFNFQIVFSLPLSADSLPCPSPTQMIRESQTVALNAREADGATGRAPKLGLEDFG